ncbi:hypothetical protein [Aeoliella mucimassa]|uniref:O-Antigen ligase n=1 Tax=Aeoliella mucimassa TaxID=2527972 RepID=A0A518AQ97_9BACT|nr:hypothetical protein [Aeoliella mucimassa]QDU56900.1 hypothetical protein Pan181_31120 [Aeoliella mucimassa]
MTPLAYLAMFGIMPLGIAFFGWMTPRKAAALTLFGAWLFLPMATIPISGFLDFNKMMAACSTVIVGVLLFDAKRVAKLQFHWVDLPIIAYCLWPGVCSVANGNGVWDGLSIVAQYLATWGGPYLVGRMYFSDADGIRYLARAFYLAGIAYMPFCLYEVRMSPQLHSMFYGFHQHSFAQTFRMGGWRPMVFMQHGLMVSLFMVLTTVIGIWLWRRKELPLLFGFSTKYFLPLMVLTTVLSRSTGALALGVVAISALFVAKHFGPKIVILPLLLIAPFWVSGRLSGVFSGEIVSQTAVAITGDANRGGSMNARLAQEDKVRGSVLSSPVFGYGRWGKGLDQLWLLEARNHGIPQVVSLILVCSLPSLLALIKMSKKQMNTAGGFAVLLAFLPLLFLLDSLVNGMVNPLYVLAAGASTYCLYDLKAVERTTESKHASIPKMHFKVVRDLHPGHSL